MQDPHDTVIMYAGSSRYSVHECRIVTILWPCMQDIHDTVTMHAGSSRYCDHVCRILTILWPCMLDLHDTVTMFAGSSRYCDHACWILTTLWPCMLDPHDTVTMHAIPSLHDHACHTLTTLWPCMYRIYKVRFSPQLNPYSNFTVKIFHTNLYTSNYTLMIGLNNFDSMITEMDLKLKFYFLWNISQKNLLTK